nr:LuxR C-terminal-related transcriptional regulator [Nocardiopsis metallicus]
MPLLSDTSPVFVGRLDHLRLLADQAHRVRTGPPGALLVGGNAGVGVAAELFISPKTASVRVSNILGKLAVPNRATAGPEPAHSASSEGREPLSTEAVGNVLGRTRSATAQQAAASPPWAGPLPSRCRCATPAPRRGPRCRAASRRRRSPG